MTTSNLPPPREASDARQLRSRKPPSKQASVVPRARSKAPSSVPSTTTKTHRNEQSNNSQMLIRIPARPQASKPATSAGRSNRNSLRTTHSPSSQPQVTLPTVGEPPRVSAEPDESGPREGEETSDTEDSEDEDPFANPLFDNPDFLNDKLAEALAHRRRIEQLVEDAERQVHAALIEATLAEEELKKETADSQKLMNSIGKIVGPLAAKYLWDAQDYAGVPEDERIANGSKPGWDPRNPPSKEKIDLGEKAGASGVGEEELDESVPPPPGSLEGEDKSRKRSREEDSDGEDDSPETRSPGKRSRKSSPVAEPSAPEASLKRSRDEMETSSKKGKEKAVDPGTPEDERQNRARVEMPPPPLPFIRRSQPSHSSQTQAGPSSSRLSPPLWSESEVLTAGNLQSRSLRRTSSSLFGPAASLRPLDNNGPYTQTTTSRSQANWLGPPPEEAGTSGTSIWTSRPAAPATRRTTSAEADDFLHDLASKWLWDGELSESDDPPRSEGSSQQGPSRRPSRVNSFEPRPLHRADSNSEEDVDGPREGNTVIPRRMPRPLARSESEVFVDADGVPRTRAWEQREAEAAEEAGREQEMWDAYYRRELWEIQMGVNCRDEEFYLPPVEDSDDEVDDGEVEGEDDSSVDPSEEGDGASQ
ncbi:hypothetical protein JAAARDRAFT_34701 [Jaapia argillacea MUCL 33604]|uniref:Uncharacterized protein n=1 Tax=Jaapia argillacea MUCL 33604 TaxID=933084 RepID=A0A067PVL6_9AGAM|nr:hypothetical protein JAAARDRAFT_34701 [Jaapia argillacea MUCL 33604]